LVSAETAEAGSPWRSEPARFLRALGFGDLWAQVLNSIIGAGIFALPTAAAALLGDRAVFGYLLAAAVMALVALALAELGSAYRRTGGPYLYARDAFGSFTGFQVGWLLLLTRITAYAALLSALLDYVAYFWPAAAGPARAGLILATLALLAALNVRGVRWGANATNALTVAKILPLVAFVIVGAVLAATRDLPRPLPIAAPDLAGATLLLVFAFSGFEAVTVPAEEARDPGVDLPKAILAGLGVVTLLYLGIQYAAARAVPDLATAAAPLAAGAENLVGRWGAVVMTAGAAVSILGTISGGIVLVPRLLYALAADGHLPALLTRVHRGYRTPDVAIVLLAVLVFPLAATGGFVALATLSTVSRLIVYAATCAAAVRLHGPLAGARAFSVPRAFPLLGGVACLALLATRRGELVAALAAIGVGAIFYAVGRAVARRRSTRSRFPT
jgi:amino acid transporter